MILAAEDDYARPITRLALRFLALTAVRPNELRGTRWDELEDLNGKEHDRKVIDLMLAHVPKEKIESAYNRAAYLPRRRELAQAWADMLSKGLPDPTVLAERPAKMLAEQTRRRPLVLTGADFRFPGRRRAA